MPCVRGVVCCFLQPFLRLIRAGTQIYLPDDYAYYKAHPSAAKDLRQFDAAAVPHVYARLSAWFFYFFLARFNAYQIATLRALTLTAPTSDGFGGGFSHQFL